MALYLFTGLIAIAYAINPEAILGIPAWIIIVLAIMASMDDNIKIHLRPASILQLLDILDNIRKEPNE